MANKLAKQQPKKGVAQKIEIECATEGKSARMEFIGPDADGDVTVITDHDNEAELATVWDRESQERVYEFLGASLGKGN